MLKPPSTAVFERNYSSTYRKSRKHNDATFLFLLGLGSATQVKLVGYLAITEIIFAVLTSYYIFTRWHTLRRSGLWPFLVMLLGWFLSAVLTDIFRSTEMSLALKGCATPLLWASAFITMYFLLRDELSLLKWYVLGSALSGVISLYIFKPGTLVGLESDYTYRILIGVSMTFVWATVLFLYPRFSRLTLIVIVVFSIISFAEGSRSAGAIAILVALLFFFRRSLFNPKNSKTIDMNRGRVLKLVVLGLLVVISISEGYRYVVLEGWLGQVERQRYISQSMSKIGILGGRSEFAAAMFAIADSPIIGHGSWAKDVKGYRLMGAELLGMRTKNLRDTSDLWIPGHSHLWGPWLWHGFLGFLFWFYMFFYICRFLIKYLQLNLRYLPFLLLFCTGSLWNILFSPVGFRPLAAASYVFLILLVENVDKSKKGVRKSMPVHSYLYKRRYQLQ